MRRPSISICTHFVCRALRRPARVSACLGSCLVVGLKWTSQIRKKIYVVLSGSVRVSLSGGTEEVLRMFDSCLIEPGEMRAIANLSHEVATMLVITFATGSERESHHV